MITPILNQCEICFGTADFHMFPPAAVYSFLRQISQFIVMVSALGLGEPLAT
jgi:predicted permease